ncbi:MAG: hypothetical protein U0795_14965 [Pirellulales bacterium]
MDIAYARRLMDEPAESSGWLRARGVRDVVAGHHALESLDQIGLTGDLLAVLLQALETQLPEADDADLALGSLGQFLQTVRSPLAFVALVERDPSALTNLLSILGASPLLGRWLIADPESFDLLRLTEGQPVDRQMLVDELVSELGVIGDLRAQTSLLQRYQRREMLRVAYGQLVCGHSAGLVEQQLATVADAICAAAWQAATQEVTARRGEPMLARHQPCRLAVLASGYFGSGRLDYSGRLSLLIVYEADGRTSGPKECTNREFFDLVARRFSSLIGQPQGESIGYQLDLSARPVHDLSRWVVSQDEVLRFYDVAGDGAARQHLMQIRRVAGDEVFADELIGQLHRLVFRPFPTQTDLWEGRMLIQQMRRRVKRLGAERDHLEQWRDLIRDVTTTAQMIYGDQHVELRTLDVPAALRYLAASGDLRSGDAQLLLDGWDRLSRLLHASQVGGLEVVGDEDLLRMRVARVAVRNREGARGSLEHDTIDLLNRLRQSLLALLNHAAGGAGDEDAAAESLLVSDGLPADKEQVLAGYGFRDNGVASIHFQQLGVEPIAFLSTRRCRHSLARIAPALLAAIARTPDPDATLANLARVSDSLGAKGVLWDLFQLNPAALQLYVDLCAASPYLASILTTNPGMIDELMDSLVLERLPSLGFLRRHLEELARGADNSELMLFGFKNMLHLTVGVRDLLGRDDIRDTTAALSDVVEVSLAWVASQEYQRLVDKHGLPMSGGQPCAASIVALGKLGGREPNYHSDHNLLFFFAGDGQTEPARGGHGQQPIDNRHFFNRWAQRVLKAVNRSGPLGRLFEVSPGFRTVADTGVLALTLGELSEGFQEGRYGLLERQGLCRARPIWGPEEFTQQIEATVRLLIADVPWQPEMADELYEARRRLEAGASPRNLKRAAGGTLDVEFLVDVHQLRWAAEHPEVMQRSTYDALAALAAAQILSAEHAQSLSDAYGFLRAIEARLRLMNAVARHDLPQDAAELRRLSYILHLPRPQQLTEQVQQVMQHTRELYEQLHRP